MSTPGRYLPTIALPPYAYVPGRAPHPRRDPRGHSFAAEASPVAALDEARWRDSQLHVRSVDLFNHGFYWEAHEGWEDLWVRAGKHTQVGAFCKALIKLAAAGVKLRQHQRPGAVTMADSARQCFFDLLRDGTVSFAGLSLPQLVALCDEVALLPLPPPAIQVVFRGQLLLT